MPLSSFAVQVLAWLAMRQIVIASFTAAASDLEARCHRADQAGEQGLSFRGVQINLGGGSAECKVGATQPALHPGGGIERFAIARLRQQLLYLRGKSGYHGRLVCFYAHRIQITCQ